MDLAQSGNALERRYAGTEISQDISAVAHFLRDAHVLGLAEPGIAAFERVGRENHFRYDFAGNVGLGHGEMCALSDDVFLLIANADIRTPITITFRCPELFRIRIASEGSEGHLSSDGQCVIVDGPSALIAIEPVGSEPARVAFAERSRMVHLYASRQGLQALCQGSEDELPIVLKSFIEGTLDRPFVKRVPLKPDALRCVEDIHACEHEGWARTLFMRAKGMEVFCHTLKMLAHEEGFGAPETSQHTARGVLRAQEILKARYASPPSLDDLAREVGVGRSGLCVGFRQLVGTSIFAYIHDLRMERALLLLNTTHDSITEIAHTIGYSHLSNFTVAVQRRFGMSPSELRRSALGISAEG